MACHACSVVEDRNSARIARYNTAEREHTYRSRCLHLELGFASVNTLTLSLSLYPSLLLDVSKSRSTIFSLSDSISPFKSPYYPQSKPPKSREAAREESSGEVRLSRVSLPDVRRELPTGFTVCCFFLVSLNNGILWLLNLKGSFIHYVHWLDANCRVHPTIFWYSWCGFGGSRWSPAHSWALFNRTANRVLWWVLFLDSLAMLSLGLQICSRSSLII